MAPASCPAARALALVCLVAEIEDLGARRPPHRAGSAAPEDGLEHVGEGVPFRSQPVEERVRLDDRVAQRVVVVARDLLQRQPVALDVGLEPARGAPGNVLRALDDLDETVSVSSVRPATAPVRSTFPASRTTTDVARALDVAHQVRGDHDADPELAADVVDQLQHVAPPERVESGGRLVEERDDQVVHERLRELDPLLHPVEYLPIAR